MAFGLNRMDLSQREGKYPVPPGASSILGVEFSGRVERLGPGVTNWTAGDEVFGLSGGVSQLQDDRHSIVTIVIRVHTPSI